MATPLDPRQKALNDYCPEGFVHISVVANESREYTGHYVAPKAELTTLQKPYQRTWSPLSSTDHRSALITKALPEKSTWLPSSTYSDAVTALENCHLVVGDKNTKPGQGTHSTLFYNTAKQSERCFQVVSTRTLGDSEQYTSTDIEAMDQQLRAHSLSCEAALDGYKALLENPQPQPQKAINDAFANYTIAYNCFDVELRSREDLISNHPETNTSYFKSCQKAADRYDPIDYFIKLVPKFAEPLFSAQNADAKNDASTRALWEHYKTLIDYFDGPGLLNPPAVKKITLIDITQKLNAAFATSSSTREALNISEAPLMRKFEEEKASYSTYSDEEFVTLLRSSDKVLPSYAQNILTPQQSAMADLWFLKKDKRYAQLAFEKQPYHPRSLIRAAIGLGYTIHDATQNALSSLGLTDTTAGDIFNQHFQNTLPSQSWLPARATAQGSSITAKLQELFLSDQITGNPSLSAYPKSELYLKGIKEATETPGYNATKQNLTKSTSVSQFTGFDKAPLNNTLTAQEAYLAPLKIVNNLFPHQHSTFLRTTTQENYQEALNVYVSTFLPAYQKYADLLSAEIAKPAPIVSDADLQLAAFITNKLIEVIANHPTKATTLQPVLHKIIFNQLTLADTRTTAALSACEATPNDVALANAAMTAVNAARALFHLTTLPNTDEFTSLNPLQNGQQAFAEAAVAQAEAAAPVAPVVAAPAAPVVAAPAAQPSRLTLRNAAIATVAVAAVAAPFVYQAYQNAMMAQNESN